MVGIAERGVGVSLLLELLARGENRLFSPISPADLFLRILPLHCPLLRSFLSPAVGGRKSNIVVIGQLTNTSLRLRRKTDTKQKQIASGRRRCAGASGLFIRFRKLQKHPHHFFIFNSERIAARAPRITTSVKQERLKRTVLPKRVNVPHLLKETAF